MGGIKLRFINERSVKFWELLTREIIESPNGLSLKATNHLFSIIKKKSSGIIHRQKLMSGNSISKNSDIEGIAISFTLKSVKWRSAASS